MMAPLPEGTTQMGWWILEGALCKVLPKMLEAHPSYAMDGFYLNSSNGLMQVGTALHMCAEEYHALRDNERSEGAHALLQVLGCRNTIGEVLFAGIQCAHICVVYPKGCAGPHTFKHPHMHSPGQYVERTYADMQQKAGPWLAEFSVAVCAEFKDPQKPKMKEVFVEHTPLLI